MADIGPNGKGTPRGWRLHSNGARDTPHPHKTEDIKTKRNLIIHIYCAYDVFMTEIGPNGKGPHLGMGTPLDGAWDTPPT